MELAWTAADIAICRSGAMTLSELLHHEVPGILIPFPASADEHQLKNALFLEKTIGGAIHLVESALNPERLFEAIMPLVAVDSEKRANMHQAIQDYKTRQKKADLGKLIIEQLKKL